MSSEIKLGLVGLDTSHCIAFTRLFNELEEPYHLSGGRIVAGFPGGSSDFELSYSRVDRFTEDLSEKFGIAILDSPEAVAERVDAVLLTSADGRAHRDLFRRVAPFRKPTFIDKPLAVTSADARSILEIAQEQGTPVMSCSSLRYAQPLVEALDDDGGGEIVGADCSGPMALEPTQPGYFWYGVHAVEMLYAALGPGCVEVRATKTQDHDLAVGTWQDGRIGTVRGRRNASSAFTAAIHRKKTVQLFDAYNHPKPAYAGMLEKVMQFIRSGQSPIPTAEMLEIIRFMEAANESRESGDVVRL